MSKKYRVINENGFDDDYGLKVGDVVTKIENGFDDDLYELPEHLHGKGHNALIPTKPSSAKEYNYVYIDEELLEEIKELENETE